jgi:hypothetical protein
MSASTTIVTNLKNAAAPTASSVTGANIVGRDAKGMLTLALAKALELKTCLILLSGVTDTGDPNLTTFNDILASLV